ncbi:MAG TPA: cytochrome c-type biogenesis CcmF C-terminal domain-containing protein, partial [Thermomicrobiaceae bacterium]|nr:cytochrome c-type biogenesis CcmF C-terminal domain-containing protein [Thermomicrobiaceae bacterium]
VRSGLISSVHAFAVSSIGPWFLGYLAVVIVVSVALLIYRLPGLQSDRAIESVVSRESGFLLNNLIFAAITFATLWGTIFPLVTQLFKNLQLTIGPPFYMEVNGPLMLALMFLMGIGPLLAWRHSSWQLLLRNMLYPVVAGVIAFPILLYLWREWVPSMAASVVIFAIGTTVMEYVRGARVRHKNTGEIYPLAVAMLVRKNGRRYGGYIVHIAIAIMALGIIGSNFFQVEREFTFKPGQTGTIDGYTLTYQGLDNRITAQGQSVGAVLNISQNGVSEGSVESYRFFYTGFTSQPTAEMGIRTIGVNDVYVVLDQFQQDGTAGLRVFINPMVSWIWIGGLVYVIGMLTLLWPSPQPIRREVVQPVREAALSEA